MSSRLAMAIFVPFSYYNFLPNYGYKREFLLQVKIKSITAKPVKIQDNYFIVKTNRKAFNDIHAKQNL